MLHKCNILWDKEGKTLNLTEFAEARNVKINAVSNYLSRHPEIKKHTVRIGKETELTPQA